MEKNLLEELYRMKSLVSYKKGEVISEQPLPLTGNQGGQLGQFPSFPAVQNSKKETTQQNPQELNIPNPFQNKFLVNCDSNPVVLDRPTANQQNDFAQKSGLNPNTPENQQYFCSSKKMSEKLSEMSKSKDTDQKKVTPTLKFIPEKFPLKYMMQGENVKKLQQALDVRSKSGQPNITGKFYNATQLALDKKAQELGLNYDRKIGLDQATFNDIVTPRKKSEPVQVVTGNERRKIEPVTVPTKISTTAPKINIQTP